MLIRTRLLARLLAGLLAGLLAASLAPAAPKVIGVNVDNIVHPITVEIVGHAIEQAGRPSKIDGMPEALAARGGFQMRCAAGLKSPVQPGREQ